MAECMVSFYSWSIYIRLCNFLLQSHVSDFSFMTFKLIMTSCVSSNHACTKSRAPSSKITKKNHENINITKKEITKKSHYFLLSPTLIQQIENSSVRVKQNKDSKRSSHLAVKE
jgi:hypothetical protein